MNRAFWLLGVLLLAVPAMPAAESQTVSFEIQLVRGTDDEKAKEADWKAVGPRLSKRLAPVFRWKHYWEVGREHVTVAQGGTKRVRLTPERTLEIAVKSDTETELRLFRKGQLVRKALLALPEQTTIMGGDAGKDEAWFVVVSRDKPR